MPPALADSRRALLLSSIAAAAAWTLPRAVHAGSLSTYTADVHVVPTTLPVVDKLPVSIALVLDDAFSSYDRRFHSTMSDEGGAGEDEYPIGPALRGYAINLVGNRFARVDVFDTVEAARNGGAAILFPSVARMIQGWGFGFGSKLSMSLVIAWGLIDKSGAVVSEMQTAGEGEVNQANGFIIRRRMGELVSVLFDDLSRNTQTAFLQSSNFQKLGV